MYHPVDGGLDRLRRADWSAGDVGTATRWLVSGTNGENVLFAAGRGRAEAWHRACEQAAVVGMLAPVRDPLGAGHRWRGE
jgi:hypothetical protein